MVNLPTLEYSLLELAVAVVLAASRPDAYARLLLTWLGKRLGVSPGEISSYQRATEEGDDAGGN